MKKFLAVIFCTLLLCSCENKIPTEADVTSESEETSASARETAAESDVPAAETAATSAAEKSEPSDLIDENGYLTEAFCERLRMFAADCTDNSKGETILTLCDFDFDNIPEIVYTAHDGGQGEKESFVYRAEEFYCYGSFSGFCRDGFTKFFGNYGGVIIHNYYEHSDLLRKEAYTHAVIKDGRLVTTEIGSYESVKGNKNERLVTTEKVNGDFFSEQGFDTPPHLSDIGEENEYAVTVNRSDYDKIDEAAVKEVLIKSGVHTAQTDFSSGGSRPQDSTKVTQEFKEFSCNMAENMQARCELRFIRCLLKYYNECKTIENTFNDICSASEPDFSMDFLCIEDYDGDGDPEAFFQHEKLGFIDCGGEVIYPELKEPYFVCGVKRIWNDTIVFSGLGNSQPCLIFTVRNGVPEEISEISLRGMMFDHSEYENGQYTMCLSAYDAPYHTWKPYFFYRNNNGNYREYGAVYVDIGEFTALTGVDPYEVIRNDCAETVGYFAEDISGSCDFPVKVESVLYRANGYYHINWRHDTVSALNMNVTIKCFGDGRYGVVYADGGVYEEALCPDIADYPEKLPRF